MRRFGLWILGAGLLVAGCAHTVNVPLQPAFQTGIAKSSALESVRPPVPFGAGSYRDGRADTTKLAMFEQGPHKFTLYGMRPMRDVLFEGLGTLLTHAGHSWGDSLPPQVRVDATLLNMQAARNAGMIAVGASSSVQVKFDFTDARTHQLLYSGIYNGSDKRSQAMIGLMSMVNASIDQSILNCVNEVGKDEKLAAALATVGKTP